MHDEVRSSQKPGRGAGRFLDRPVLVVLCLSLAISVVALAVLWLGFFAPSA